MNIFALVFFHLTVVDAAVEPERPPPLQNKCVEGVVSAPCGCGPHNCSKGSTCLKKGATSVCSPPDFPTFFKHGMIPSFNKAMREKDLDALLHWYEPGAVLTMHMGMFEGPKVLRGFFGKMISVGMTSFDFDTESPDYSYAVLNEKHVINQGPYKTSFGTHGWCTILWRKSDGGEWKVLFQAMVRKRAPNAQSADTNIPPPPKSAPAPTYANDEAIKFIKEKWFPLAVKAMGDHDATPVLPFHDVGVRMVTGEGLHAGLEGIRRWWENGFKMGRKFLGGDERGYHFYRLDENYVMEVGFMHLSPEGQGHYQVLWKKHANGEYKMLYSHLIELLAPDFLPPDFPTFFKQSFVPSFSKAMREKDLDALLNWFDPSAVMTMHMGVFEGHKVLRGFVGKMISVGMTSFDFDTESPDYSYAVLNDKHVINQGPYKTSLGTHGWCTILWRKSDGGEWKILFQAMVRKRAPNAQSADTNVPPPPESAPAPSYANDEAFKFIKEKWFPIAVKAVGDHDATPVLPFHDKVVRFASGEGLNVGHKGIRSWWENGFKIDRKFVGGDARGYHFYRLDENYVMEQGWVHLTPEGHMHYQVLWKKHAKGEYKVFYSTMVDILAPDFLPSVGIMDWFWTFVKYVRFPWSSAKEEL